MSKPKKPKEPGKVEMTWDLRQLLPPSIHEQWDTLTVREQNLIAEAVRFAEGYTRNVVADSYYNSMEGYCDRPHADED